MSSLRPTLGLLLAFAAGMVLLHGCQETPEVTEPDLAVVVLKTLTVKGLGNGSGVITSSPAGINCAITAGSAASTGCIASFPKGTVVTLTAAPQAGHALKVWSNACSGSGTCQVTMTVNRTVVARLVKGPFTVRISAGSGVGSGTVTSQAGLLPAINCTITNGVPAATGCSVKYPAYTSLVLTATPAAGHEFLGWGAPCGGAGGCTYVVISTATIAARFGPAVVDPVSVRGVWGAPVSTPVVAIHMTLLRTGKVLLWGHTGDAHLYDPANPGAGFQTVGAPYEIFCSGHALMADGRVFVAGGHISNNHGLPTAAIFDPASETWSSTTPMSRGRWYPTVTALPNGEMLVLAGTDEGGAEVTVPEIWNGSSWRQLTSASLALPYYPAMFPAPDGRIFFAGFATTTRYLDVSGTGAWSLVGERVGGGRPTGSAVSYAPGKVLYAGGGEVPKASAEVIDLSQPSPAWRSVGSMAYARRHMLATLLADASVLVTHGTGGLSNDQTAAIRTAERWDPATENWTTMASEARTRVYHSSAVLLPDGRVLSGGSGEGSGITYANSEFSLEVFSPPYLFAADGSPAVRPVITTAPATVGYGGTIEVETPDAGTVTRGTLIRLSSATHSFNESQLAYPLVFSAAGAGTIQAPAPAGPSLAPPGYYMLFLVSPAGVPSVSRMVRVRP